MVPQLLLGHFIADYPAQTDWLFSRKVAGWAGLLLHGGVVLVAQASAVFPNTLQLFWLLLVMSAAHVVQDYLKIQYGHLVSRRYPVIPYLLDQILHVLLIAIAGPLMVRTVGASSPAVQWTAAVATALVVLTWSYYITWRVVIGNDHPFPVAWRWIGSLERTLAFLVSLFGFVWLAPLAFIPRLVVAWGRGVSLVGERYLLLDAVLGILLSAVTGFFILHFLSF